VGVWADTVVRAGPGQGTMPRSTAHTPPLPRTRSPSPTTGFTQNKRWAYPTAHSIMDVMNSWCCLPRFATLLSYLTMIRICRITGVGGVGAWVGGRRVVGGWVGVANVQPSRNALRHVRVQPGSGRGLRWRSQTAAGYHWCTPAAPVPMPHQGDVVSPRLVREGGETATCQSSKHPNPNPPTHTHMNGHNHRLTPVPGG
jgi:hypothetical protein